ncbi:NADPH-dependent F420 reductase [Rhodococcus koreensis]
MTRSDPTTPQTVAVIGAGVIGRTLATRWSAAGHTVTFGVRRPDDPFLREFAAKIAVTVETIDAAVAAADTVLFAVDGAAMETVTAAVGAALDGRTVIDATNNLGHQPLNSIAAVTEQAPTAQVFRAFNSLGWENFADPGYGDLAGDLLYSGPAGASQQRVETLISNTWLRPIWLGGNDKAHICDTITELWFTLAFEREYGRGVGIKVLTRAEL